MLKNKLHNSPATEQLREKREREKKERKERKQERKKERHILITQAKTKWKLCNSSILVAYIMAKKC
jgi:hypothetical protein